MWGYHLLEGFTGSNHIMILPIKGREQHVPDSSNHALFPENEGNFWGNQLPDGSISLSPLCRKRTICPKRAFARDSPDFAFFRHFWRFFRALLLITGNSGKIIKPRTPFLARYGHPWTEKRSENGHFSQRIVFTLPLGFADDFGPRS